MKKRTWTSVEDWFETMWRGKHRWCFRFQDTRDARGLTQSKKVYNAEQPSDFIVTDDGITFFAEVKFCAEAVSFPLSNIRPGQWRAATQQVAAGGLYYFFIFSAYNECWYRVPAEVILETHKTKKSIKWIDIYHYEWTPPQLGEANGTASTTHQLA